eukprot:CAMPEP_0168787302 /NCGR_PEP_ID=MMETSP0725-20121227/11727_1 /TAXON_ID=265536 /ORGANISM="Amphiprora sp., Strain CCMP467" /LENGTH=367 /DNA_ID=CAMNT_0008837497 /DNA_START=25 /DNA_END=1128 /DNA_ORIENTATION=+
MSHLEPLVINNDCNGGTDHPGSTRNRHSDPNGTTSNGQNHHHQPRVDNNNHNPSQHQQPQQQPVRRHSLPGQRLARRPMKRQFPDMESFLLQESIAVALWSFFVPILSFVVDKLMDRASHKNYYWSSAEAKDYPRFVVSLIAWCWLHLLPRKLRSGVVGMGGGTPGFVLSHIWLLLRVEESFGMYPNLACRICEWRLGRIRNRAMILALLIHSIVPCLVWGTLAALFSNQSSLGSPLFSLRYSLDHDEFGLVYFARELLVSILFPLVVMVLPPLLKLNGLPEWATFFCLYPIYSTGVDSSDRGSTLSPGAVLAQALYFWRLDCRWRLGAQFLGSFIAGTIMTNAFPGSYLFLWQVDAFVDRYTPLTE